MIFEISGFYAINVTVSNSSWKELLPILVKKLKRDSITQSQRFSRTISAEIETVADVYQKAKRGEIPAETMKRYVVEEGKNLTINFSKWSWRTIKYTMDCSLSVGVMSFRFGEVVLTYLRPEVEPIVKDMADRIKSSKDRAVINYKNRYQFFITKVAEKSPKTALVMDKSLLAIPASIKVVNNLII
ncbi:hypothetical protein O9G_005035, partial [Rozella allomycis CSF55]